MSSSVTCPCGATFEGSRRDARFCSRRCRSDAYRDKAGSVCETPSCQRPIRAKGLCTACYKRRRRADGQEQEAPWNDRRRDAYHRRRAVKKQAATGEVVSLDYIRRRDCDRCHICRKRMGKQVWPHPLSPSLDHLVPLTKGGAHDPSNVRLAHLACNITKGNRGGNEQLLLIG